MKDKLLIVIWIKSLVPRNIKQVQDEPSTWSVTHKHTSSHSAVQTSQLFKQVRKGKHYQKHHCDKTPERTVQSINFSDFNNTKNAENVLQIVQLYNHRNENMVPLNIID